MHPHPHSMSPALIVLLLAVLLGLQPVTTDLYLPALPLLRDELGASMGQAQQTLSSLLLAFGVSQLVWGPLSDRFGRKPILLAGLALYCAAALACVFAASIESLIFWRAVQGVAMGASVMGARAILRDLYAPAQGAHVMSKALSGLGVLACLSAPVGGVVVAYSGWRATLVLVLVFGIACLVLLAWRFEETLAHRNPRALHWRTLARNWWHIGRHPVFLSFSALTLAAYSGLFTFLAGSSFVFMQVFGFTPAEYGLVMLTNSALYIAGTFLCRACLRRFGLRRTVALGAVLTFGGACTMLALVLAGVHSAWAIELPFTLFMVAHGIHNPVGQSGSVGPFPQAAGAASALNGFLAMLAAFATGRWLGANMNGTEIPLVMGIWFWSSALALVAWTLVQRHGKD